MPTSQDPKPAKQRSFAADSILVLAARLVSVASNFATSILIARLLGPTAVGIMAIIFVVPTILNTIATLGVRQAVTYYIGKRLIPDRDLVQTMLWLALRVSILGVIITGAAYLLNGAFKYGLILALAGMAFPPMSLLFDWASGIALGKNWIGRFSMAHCLPAFATLVATALFIWVFKGGVGGACIAKTLGVACATVYGLWLLSLVSPLGFAAAPGVAKQLISLGIIYSVALFVFSVNYNVAILVLQHYVHPDEVGQFSVGNNVAQLLYLLPQAVGMVVLARSATSRDPRQFAIKTCRLLRCILPLAILAGVVAVLLAPWIVVLMYGENFQPAGNILRIMIIGVIAGIIHKILHSDLAGRGRPDVALWVYIPVVTLNIALQLVLVPLKGVTGAAWAATSSYVTGGLVFMWVYAHVSDLSVWEMLLPSALLRRYSTASQAPGESDGPGNVPPEPPNAAEPHSSDS